MSEPARSTDVASDDLIEQIAQHWVEHGRIDSFGVPDRGDWEWIKANKPFAEFNARHIAKWAIEAVAAARISRAPIEAVAFQQRVKPWMMACFGAEISSDRVEHNHRFLEEALELVQSIGCTQSEAHQLVDYVFGRDIGEPIQEAGGVMVTLAALCLANDLDMDAAGETELARIWTKVEKIRAKQAAKPAHSPLPAHPLPQGEAALGKYAYSAALEATARAQDCGCKSIDSCDGSCTILPQGGADLIKRAKRALIEEIAAARARTLPLGEAGDTDELVEAVAWMHSYPYNTCLTTVKPHKLGEWVPLVPLSAMTSLRAERDAAKDKLSFADEAMAAETQMRAMRENGARPIASLGEIVMYYDRQDRAQRGEVLRIEASWSGFSGDPLIIYTLQHPTYHNNRCYATADRFASRAALAPVTTPPAETGD